MTEELNICGAEDDDAPEGRCAGVQLGQDGRCIAHTDDRKAREAAFERLRGGGDLDFTQGVPIDGDLLSAILEACTQIDGRRRLHNANFGSSRFVSVARFMAVSFADWARFDGASFGDGARFEGAKFGDWARFDGASFGDWAWFDGAKFGDGARFEGASFGDRAWFGRAKFGDGAYFEGASFGDRALFVGAKFGDGAVFGRLLVRGDMVLHYATLSQPDLIELACGRMVSHRLRLPGGIVAFRVGWAEIDFSEADLSAPTTLSPLLLDALPENLQNQLSCWAPTDDPQPRPRIISLQRANVAGLILTDVDLAACQFAGAHNLDKVRLEGNTTFAFPPRGWHRAGWRVWRWTRRDTLAEEQKWRARSGYVKRAGWYTEATGAVPRTQDSDDEPLEPRWIAALYRDLRKAREDAKDEPGAADFYYGEMEMRRHAAQPVERAILWLYWAVSGYGLRASRALAALALLVVLLVPQFQLCGFGDPDAHRSPRRHKRSRQRSPSPGQPAARTAGAKPGQPSLTSTPGPTRPAAPWPCSVALRRNSRVRVACSALSCASSARSCLAWRSCRCVGG